MAKTLTLSGGKFVLSGEALKAPIPSRRSGRPVALTSEALMVRTPPPRSAVGMRPSAAAAPRAKKKTGPMERKQFSFPKSKMREMKQAALDLDYKSDSQFMIDHVDCFMNNGFLDAWKAKQEGA